MRHTPQIRLGSVCRERESSQLNCQNTLDKTLGTRLEVQCVVTTAIDWMVKKASNKQ